MTTYIISLTLLAAAVTILRAAFRKNVSAKLIYAMWLAVVLRLCLPFDLILLDIPTPDLFKESNGMTGYEQTEAVSEREPTFVTPSTEALGNIMTGNVSVDVPVIPEVNGNTNTNVNTGASVAPVIPDTPSQMETPPQADAPATEAPPKAELPIVESPSQMEEPVVGTPDVKSEVKLSVKQTVIAIWLCGSVVTLAAFGISWIVFSIKLMRNRRYFGRTGRTKIYVSDKVSSPCVYGVFPRIYITPEAESSEHLSVILLHEKTHIAHGDHIWNLVRVAAVVLHWWNPVIWVSAILSKRDAELACDETVAKQLDSREKLEYARMIVDMIPVKKNYAVSFAGGPIKERIMKLTKEHKNKIIIAVVAVVLVAGCLAAAFIGAKDESTDAPASTDTVTEDAETTEDTETTETPETTEELPEPDPVPMYGLLKVYEATEENLAKLVPAKEYDISAGEYNFSMIMVPDEDIADFKLTRLTWNEELLVEGEEVIEDIGEVKAGEAVLLTADSVEIIGYTGISYTKDGETVRYYPATSGMDGSAILVEIGSEMLTLDVLYHGLPRYEVTLSADMSLAKLISELPRDIDKQTGFYYDERKVLTVYGLSVPVHIEFGEYYKTRSFAAYGKIAYNTGTWGETNYGSVYELSEYNGAVIISCDHYDMYVNTAVFTPEEVSVFDSESGVSTNIEINGDDLVYERVSVKFKRPVTQTATAPLDLAVSRDEFFKETGVARFENGKLILEEPDESFAIGEAYDLDALFEEYKLNYLGYESVDEVLERNSKGEEPSSEYIMPTQDHLGVWTTEDYVNIYEVTDTTVKFSGYQYRSLGFDATAVLTDGEWVFVSTDESFDENRPNSNPVGISGKLRFTEDSVTIIYESLGENEEHFKYAGAHTGSITFTHRIVNINKNGREEYRRIYDCGGNYNSTVFGHYKVTFSIFDNQYTTNPVLSVCNGGCLNEQQSGSNQILIAEYGVEDGWQYPVKVYAYEMEEGVEPGTMRYNYLKRYSRYVFDIGDGLHYSLGIHVSNYNYNAYENEQEVLDGIAKNASLEYTLLNDKTGEVYTPVHKNAEVSADHLEKAETDVRYKWITSFIGKDVDGCAEVLAEHGKRDAFDDYKKLLAPLEDMYFRYYEVTDIEEEYPGDADRLLFKFYVERSNYDVYPVGYYEAELSVGGIDSFGCYLVKRPKLPASGNMVEYEKELEFVSHFFALCSNVNFPEDPYSDEGGWWNMTENLLLIYEKANGITNSDDVRITKAELIELAYELYGIENYQLNPRGYGESADGYCCRLGHGGTSVKVDTIRVNEENGVISFDVRYYGDVTRFGIAHVVRYSIERTDSPYGFRLVKIEKIVDNGVSHWARMV